MERKNVVLGKLELVRLPEDNELRYYIPINKYHINPNEIEKIEVSRLTANTSLLEVKIDSLDEISVRLNDILKAISKTMDVKAYSECIMDTYRTLTNTLDDLLLDVYINTIDAPFNCLRFKLLMDYIPIDVVMIESNHPDPNQRLSFKGIENQVKRYTLEKEKLIKHITNNGRMFTVLASDVPDQVEPAFDLSRYKIVLEDFGDPGVPGCNCIESASLVLGDMNRVVSKISVSGYGLDLAIYSLMETYKYMYLCDMISDIRCKK